MQVIGLCRFSYPALGGFQVEHETIGDRIAYLYAADRIEERFRLFEAIALPCLRAQTDHEFDFVILIGDSLPDTYRDRLHDLTGDMPQIKILAHPPINNREICKDLLNQARRNPGQPCIQFRFDDDDAIAVDFVEKARAAARDCRPLTRGHRAVAFTWPNGYVARVGADGIAAAELYRPMNTAGLAMHVAGKCRITIHNFMHERIARFMPTVSLTDPAMFLRTHNSYNDSRQKPVKQVPMEPLDSTQQQLFRDRFNVDPDQVRLVFAR